MYVPKWSLVELTYFAFTTNYLIGFGDLMPCSDLHGQSRSKCAVILSSKLLIFLLLVFYTFILMFVVPFF